MRILVVDDNRSSADALARVLRKQGDDVVAVYDGRDAIEQIRVDAPDLVLTDLKMEPVDGMEVLRVAREQRPPAEVIVFTAYGAIETAVEAMRIGARDFLTKPVTADQLLHRIDRLRGPEAATQEMEPVDTGDHFLANAASSRDLLEFLRQAATAPSRVWLEGEIGSGRGHAARTLHRLSGGHGGFSILDLGRDVPWPDAGTVLLPNVDDLPEDLQRRLIGRLKYVPEGVRLVATASPEATERLHAEKLSAELYYALSVVVITVPPLRSRREDIVPLMEVALSSFAKRYKRRPPEISESQARRLADHPWRGNIRELLNLAERAVVMGTEAFNQIEPAKRTSSGLPTLQAGFNLAAYMETLERRILEQALRQCNGDRVATGKLLGVERNTLRYKLRKHKLI